MVDPADVPRVVKDAARLVRSGELVVFGSSALAFWLEGAPSTRDVDVYCTPADAGDAVVALMGELSWYHDRHGAYVEVWAPETFAAPEGWRERARRLPVEEAPGVQVIVPHPHDVLFSKLERFEERDVDHARCILAEHPLSAGRLDELARAMPHRRGEIAEPERSARFEHGLKRLTELAGVTRRG